MKAVGFWQPGESTSVIEDLSLPPPSMPKGRDLLIRVRAVAVNPRDLKSRRNISPSAGNLRKARTVLTLCSQLDCMLCTRCRLL